MKTKNFNTYKFHCSFLPVLTVNARKKDEVLSETAKTALRELWIKEVYGREKLITTNAMEKGTAVESDSLDLLEQVMSLKYFKNQKQIENDYVVGTPDVLDPLVDIKSSWDLWTYAEVDEDKARKAYYGQLLGYAWLTGAYSASLVYALVDTPDYIVDREIFRLTYNMAESDAERYRKNYKFDDIDPPARIKKYEFTFTDEDIAELQDKIVAARKYMSGLSLGG